MFTFGTATAFEGSADVTDHHLINWADNQALWFYREVNALKGRHITDTDLTPSSGTEIQIAANVSPGVDFGVNKMGASHFLTAYGDGGNNDDLVGTAGTISGTSFSLGSATLLHNSDAEYPAVAAFDDDNAMVLYNDETAGEIVEGVTVTRSTLALSAGTPVAIGNFSFRRAEGAQFGNFAVFIAIDFTGVDPKRWYLRSFERNLTSLTELDEVELQSNNVGFPPRPQIIRVDTNRGVVSYPKSGTTIVLRAFTIDESGQITLGAESETTTISENSLTGLTNGGTGQVIFVYPPAVNAGAHARLCEINWNTLNITLGDEEELYNSTDNVFHVDVTTLNNGKALFVFTENTGTRATYLRSATYEVKTAEQTSSAWNMFGDEGLIV